MCMSLIGLDVHMNLQRDTGYGSGAPLRVRLSQ
jgi:hypothetical protein